jgi:hypothetical protein
VGGLTAVLRFVPYVGTALAALLPACLAFAIFPGWAETLQTLAVFLALTCIVAISSTRGAEARNYCRRIRAARPSANLLVVRPLPDQTDAERSVARMKEAGADRVAINLQQALRDTEELISEIDPRVTAERSPGQAHVGRKFVGSLTGS